MQIGNAVAEFYFWRNHEASKRKITEGGGAVSRPNSDFMQVKKKIFFKGDKNDEME